MMIMWLLSFIKSPIDDNPKPLNNLIKDLGLSKEDSELLKSRLKKRNLLELEITFAWYKHRKKEFVPFFFPQVNSLLFATFLI